MLRGPARAGHHDALLRARRVHAERTVRQRAYRGVDTTIIFPARNDSWIVGAASRSYYADLLEAGVKIYEYVGGLLHTKSLTLDGEVTLIGSANMDRRSFELNYENNILFVRSGADRRRAAAPAGAISPFEPGPTDNGARLAVDAPTVEQHHRHARAGAVEVSRQVRTERVARFRAVLSRSSDFLGSPRSDDNPLQERYRLR